MFTFGPHHGLLGATFVSCRILQLVSALPVIGITSNFISEFASSHLPLPSALVGTLVIACIGALHSVISGALYAISRLPFKFNAGFEALYLIALIVVVSVVGKPLTHLDCQAIGQPASASDHSKVKRDLSESNVSNIGDMDLYGRLVESAKSPCLEMKAVWGLSFALLALYCISLLCSIILWRKKPAKAKELSPGA